MGRSVETIPRSGVEAVKSKDQFNIDKAASLIREADALLITAGAGMGVDSGLPDFRGSEGFWEAYPALAQARIDFSEIANPKSFRLDPNLAWGFYGHRLNLYRSIQPHPGFKILLEWAKSKAHGAFVYTSNVDGQFQKAGFPEELVHECHGSIHHLQCTDSTCGTVWSAHDLSPDVDHTSCKMISSLPRCPVCRKLARPNILMFGDSHWVPERYDRQELLLSQWMLKPRKLVIIELGAGLAVPTVRRFGERQGVPLIRINVRNPEGRHSDIVSIPMGACEALSKIQAVIVDTPIDKSN